MKHQTQLFKFLLLIFLFQINQIIAQKKDLIFETGVEKVTIHLRGAEIIRTEEMTLSVENQRVVFTGLSPKLDPKSVQITATNEVNILSISSKINFIPATPQPPPIIIDNKAQLDSIKMLDLNGELLNAEIISIQKELEILKLNQNLRAPDEPLSLEVLEKAADIYKDRFHKAHRRLVMIESEKRDLIVIKKGIQERMKAALAAKKIPVEQKKPISEIYVALDNDAGESTKLKVRYVVQDAGWSPIYDLQANEIDAPILLKYRALAYNGTGVDWENVKIKLSTSDPNQGAGQPILTKWELNYNPNKSGGGLQNGVGRLNLSNHLKNSQNMVIQDNKIISNIQFETIEISELSSDFEIDESYSIPSDRAPYSIEIGEYDLPATYKHYAVPKMEKDAFLLAQITGWEDLDLISGPMNVYQGDDFVGLAALDAATLNDTLELSLGRDKKVLVQRLKLKDFSKKRFLSGNVVSAFRFKISVKNNHKSPINLEILDQVPVSNNEKIEVALIEKSKAQLYPNSGKLQWEFNLEPSKKKELFFEYSVKHPKGVEVKTRRMKKMVLPRYF